MAVVGSIGTPCEEFVHTEYMLSMFRLAKPADTLCTMVKGAGVAENRNLIVKRFEGDWLLFVDSDMIFGPDVLHRLLAHGDLDIVHAVCCQKLPPYRFCTWDAQGKRLQPPLGKDLIESTACGMAFTLIRRRVFAAMPEPWFEVGKGGDSTALYEDIWFCRKARRLGFKIWADPTIPIWHLALAAVAVGPDGRPMIRPGNSRYVGITGEPQWEREMRGAPDGEVIEEPRPERVLDPAPAV